MLNAAYRGVDSKTTGESKVDWTQIVVALIAAVGGIGVAWVTVKKRGDKPEKGEGNDAPTFQVSAGNDAFVAGRDNIIHQNKDLVGDFFSKDAVSILVEASKEAIPNEGERLEWSSFDAKLLSAALIQTPRGPGFNNAAAIPYHSPHYLKQWMNGGLVYATALKKMEKLGPRFSDDVKRINGTLQIYYVNAKIVDGLRNDIQQLDEGVYLDMDDERAISKAKEMKAFRALDMAGAKGGVSVFVKEEANEAGDINMHVFMHFTDQIAADNGFVHLVAYDVNAHPDRKNKIWVALDKGYGFNPDNAVSLD